MTCNTELQDWLFHYNPYKKEWCAFKRDQLNDYFNGTLKDAIISKNHRILVSAITKANGDEQKIKLLVRLAQLNG